MTGRRVAIIGTRGYPSYYGGFETAVRRLAPYLSDRGWSVTVYGRPDSRGGEADGDDRVRTVITRGLDSKSLSTLSFGLTSSVHAARERPDVAIVMNVANGYWLPLLRSRGVPTVVNVDGIEWERAKWGRAARAVFRGGAWMASKHATTLVFDAREIERRWRSLFNASGVFIPYGGDVVRPLPVEAGLTSGGYALVVARFVPENTIPEFFSAVPRIANTAPVVIVGSSGYGGELDERARALADGHPNVRWLGHIRDDARLFSLWQHAGAYFHGHSVGGTNPALVQAMACGAPVVARDTPYNREVLSTAGEFVEASPTEIADRVLEVLGNPERVAAMGDLARERAKTHYTWESVCEAYHAAAEAAIAVKLPTGAKR